LILLSSLSQSYDHIVTTMLTVKKFSSWRRSRQLSYLMRIEKAKSRGADRIEFGGHRKERKRRRKEKFGLIKCVSLLSQGRSLEE